ncbi:MAG TPA: glycosyltransferase family 4 protein [Anaerolineae bacterium]|nr:glycosyltransferase family 4 protein [Anaerolineae bacterium]
MRILFVAMANSIHTARWMHQLVDQGWDIHLFPVDFTDIHPDLRNLTFHNFLYYRPLAADHSVRVVGSWPFPRGFNTARRIAERLGPRWSDRAWQLARAIRKLRPDIVHSMEMQHAGYLTLDARNQFDGPFPPWIYSSWGSDLFYFGRLPEHEQRIRAVLGTCDFHIADCQRDVRLARKFGFEGEALGVLPGGGGFDIERMLQFRQAAPISARKVIALKGYHDDNWAGRALVALEALHMCASYLAEYEIAVYLAGPNVRYAAEYVSRITGLRVTVLPQSSHDQVLKAMGRARIAIGVSVSDGTPNTMLEAMVMGAFPIQSDTVSTAEWITHGENGLLVPPEDPQAIASAIRRALTDDRLVERAAEINLQLAHERVADSVVRPRVIEIYEHVARQAALHRCN